MNDEDIKKWCSQWKNIPFKKIINNNLFPDYIKYLENRFDDTTDVRESLYRIKNNINESPICPICGNHIKWIGKYNKTCSSKCKYTYAINKAIKTNLKKYGVSYQIASDHTKQKIKETNIERYGVDCTLKYNKTREKIKETNIKKYGCDNPLGNKDIIKKRKDTMIKKYGVDHNWKSEILRKKAFYKNFGVDSYSKTDDFKEKFKNTCIKKFGYPTPLNQPYVKAKAHNKISLNKIYISKKKNHSFGQQSKEESICYLYLSLMYPDTIRQYKDSRYPYNCDFYIPCLDLFIEFQGYWTHGEHPFNPNDINDINRLNLMKNKYGENSIYIDIWINKDPEKRKCAKDHNLNYIEFFTLNELINWINM